MIFFFTDTEEVEQTGLAKKDTIVISMLTVLVVLVIGNLIIVGYCLYSRYGPCVSMFVCWVCVLCMCARLVITQLLTT